LPVVPQEVLILALFRYVHRPAHSLTDILCVQLCGIRGVANVYRI
jgi:hypothetical protein